MAKREAIRMRDMAYEIAHRAGEALVGENYYTDYTYGCRYKFDSLEITHYFDKGAVQRITIFIGGRNVLYYVYDTKKFATFIDGTWTKLIEEIYSELDNLEYEKDSIKEKYKEKEAELRQLEEVLKVFIDDCRYRKALEWYNEKFSIYNMKVVKKTKYISTGTINEASGSFEEFPRGYYEIYYDDEKVLTFNDDKYDLYRFCGDYVNEYKPGLWSYLLKSALKDYKEYKENETRNIADSSADEVLRRFRGSRR